MASQLPDQLVRPAPEALGEDGPLGRAATVVLRSDEPAWTDFLAGRGDATPFHHPAWSRVLASSYGYRAFALALSDGGRLIAGLPMIEVRGLRGRRWLSLPFTDECVPLAVDSRSATELLRRMPQVCEREGLTGIEVRADVAGPGLTPHPSGVTHLLALGRDPDKIRATFSRSQVQRNIVRAEREQIRIEWASSEPDLTDCFYRLHVDTRRRQGVPVQPRRFFELLWREMIEPGLGFVLIARAGAKPVAAAVFLTWQGNVVYKFGASDAGSWKLRPNHLLFWHAIRWSCEQGFRQFDFGRTDLDNEGLRAFKSSWGTQERPLVYATAGNATSRGGHSRLAAVLGTPIRRSPPWLCRALGAVLYRYAA